MLFFALLHVAIWLAKRFLSGAAWAPTSSDPHLSRAASGASDAPSMPRWRAIDEYEMKNKEVQSADWIKYRYAYPPLDISLSLISQFVSSRISYV